LGWKKGPGQEAIELQPSRKEKKGEKELRENSFSEALN